MIFNCWLIYWLVDWFGYLSYVVITFHNFRRQELKEGKWKESMLQPISYWVVPVFLLEYCMITLRIWCLLLNLSFDVLSVICRLHNLRPPFRIPFYLVPPIVFSFRAHAFFYMGTIRRFSWNGTCVALKIHW